MAMFTVFVDGDGFIRVRRMSSRGYIGCTLQITQHERDLSNLEYFQEVLGIGSIRCTKDRVF